MKKRIFGKSLAVAVILLFLGLAIQPSIATVQQQEERIDVETKDYLFRTIIDIVNNPEIKNLLEQYDNDFLKVDIDRNLYHDILFRNARLLFQLIFTKPSMSNEYLDFAYNQGIKITNIIDEDKALEIIESVDVTDTRLFDELNIIIKNDEELTIRTALLKDLNKDLKSDSPFQGYPIVCYIVIIILFPILLLVELTEMDNIIGWLLALITCPFMMFLEIVGLVFFAFGENIGCW